MSGLNAAAFEFVPGKSFKPPPIQSVPEPAPQPAQSSLPSLDNQGPPQVISLNIGGSKPTPPATPPAPQQLLRQKTQPPKSQTPTPKPDASPAPATTIKLQPAGSNVTSSKNFTIEKAKTDTTVISNELHAVADRDTLKDLFGNVKEHLNIVFIGHVDAGKSTIGGNLLYLCGTVDKRTMEKLEKEAKEAGQESWYLSWALDSTPQEREKGKTVEVGRAYFETDSRRYTILDAPGHKTYVPSMISGAAQADVAILVISARKGEFETGFEKGGQTREHIMLVKTAGVNRLVCVINKMDDPSVDWSKARYNEIKDKMILFTKATGYKDVPFLPISGYTGENLKEKSKCEWWDGPSLLGYLDSMPMVDRKINAPLMMPVTEKYKDMGTVIVGKIESGRLRKGEALTLMPNKDAVEVVAIYNEIEEEVSIAHCGDNVRVRIRGVDDEDITPGFVLTSPKSPIHAVCQFEAQLVILDHKNIICAGYTAVMHIHTLAEEVTLPKLLHYFDKASGRKSKKPPQFAKTGQKIVAVVEAQGPVCVEKFADHPQLGRFTLRDEGKTVAIGKITRLIERGNEDVTEGVAHLSMKA